MKEETPAPIADNRRIAKNTVFLYLRSFLMLLISLYTSRVILSTLGVTDYGIVGAVAGAVGMFSMVTTSFIGAISRFVTFELGRGNKEKLNGIFCSSVNVIILLGIVVLILGLTIGLWFLHTKMSIPDGRMTAATWVMCCSLLTMVVGMQITPYSAVIVAHEDMSVFAYFSILDALMKLGIVYLLLIGGMDKLILYSLLQLGVAIVMRTIYYAYCKRKYTECNYHFIIDKESIKEMFGFAGWTALNSVVYTFNKQGIEILINIFFGVLFNAARTIAVQVEGTINQFVSNFMAAMSPQITKLYAAGDRQGMFTLMCRGAKFSYFLMLFFAYPVILEAETILDLWLGVYPEEAIIFTRLSVLLSMAFLMGNTLLTGCFAVGQIRSYSIKASIVSSFLFIGTLIFFKLGFRVEWTYFVSFIVLICMIGVRLSFLKEKAGFPITFYIKKTVFPCIYLTGMTFIFPASLHFEMNSGLMRLISVCAVSTICNALILYFLGLTAEEKSGLGRIIFSKFK